MSKKNEKKEKVEEEVLGEVVSYSIEQPTELEKLRRLYTELKERGINSIGDLENQIARLQK